MSTDSVDRETVGASDAELVEAAMIAAALRAGGEESRAAQ